MHSYDYKPVYYYLIFDYFISNFFVFLKSIIFIFQKIISHVIYELEKGSRIEDKKTFEIYEVNNRNKLQNFIRQLQFEIRKH